MLHCVHICLIVFLLQLSGILQAAELLTNPARFNEAPKWVTRSRVDRVADKVQSYLEWSIRRTQVTWYPDADAFFRSHQTSPTVRAFYRGSDNSIHLGPDVTEKNFDQILGHELTHAVLAQKHKGSVPRWFEEGLANFISKNGQVDWAWLKTQPLPEDVRTLVHPLTGSSEGIRLHYQASQALAEFLNSKCDLRNLLRLSVGRKLEDYLLKICRVQDLNVDFRTWMKSQGPRP